MCKKEKIERNIYYDKKNDTYYVLFYYGKDGKTGKIKKKYMTVKSIEEARMRLANFEYDKKNNGLGKDSFGKYCIEWLQNEKEKKDREETTLYGYECTINNHILPYLGEIELKELKYKDFENYFKSLKNEKNLSDTTRNKHKALLSIILKAAVREEKVTRNFMEDFDRWEEAKPDISHYSIEECKVLLEKVKGHNLEIAIYLALFCGLRREEVNGLRWRNVHLEKRYFSIKEVITTAGATIVKKEPKSKKSVRNMGIPDPVFKVLIKIKQEQEENKKLFGDNYEDNDLVFCKNDGRPFRPNYISSELLRFIKKQDLPHITFHGLRHSYATICNNDAKLDLKYISMSMGHADENITKDVYIHEEKLIHRKAPDAIAKLIAI